MKEKPVYIFKGKAKKEFDAIYDRLQAHKRTIERLSVNVFRDEKLLWCVVRKVFSEFKNQTNIVKSFSFKYNYETGEIFRH